MNKTGGGGPKARGMMGNYGEKARKTGTKLLHTLVCISNQDFCLFTVICLFQWVLSVSG